MPSFLVASSSSARPTSTSTSTISQADIPSSPFTSTSPSSADHIFKYDTYICATFTSAIFTAGTSTSTKHPHAHQCSDFYGSACGAWFLALLDTRVDPLAYMRLYFSQHSRHGFSYTRLYFSTLEAWFLALLRRFLIPVQPWLRYSRRSSRI